MGEIFEQSTDSVMMLKNWQFPGLTCGFTTKHGGRSTGVFSSNNLGLHVNDIPEHVTANRRKLAEILGFPLSEWACPDQVHAANIVKVSEPMRGLGAARYEDSIKGTDGLYTRQKNILLSLCYADCVPVYYYAPAHEVTGLAHAGWKGTVKNIAGKMVQLWNMNENVPPGDVYAAIGPSIGPCCYTVDDRVIRQVDETLEYTGIDIKPYAKVSEGQYDLDLKLMNKLLLMQAGVKEERIAVTEYCTSCSEDLFFSHRRDKGQTGRMMAFSGMK